MGIQTQRLKVDISKAPAIADVLNLGQGDKNGTMAIFEVYDNGVAYSLTNYSVRLAVHLPHDGGYWETMGTVSNNVATFNIDESYAAAVKGQGFAYVEVMSGDTVVCSTSRVVVNVLRSAYDGVNPATVFTNGVEEFLDDAQNQLSSAVQTANAEIRETVDEATQALNAAERTQQQAARQLDAALDALGDISEIAVPLMSETTRGGAMLGGSVQTVDGDLEIRLVDSGSGETITAESASYLNALTVYGSSVQDGTPTPDAPVPVQVVSGRNLLEFRESSTTSYGVSFSISGGHVVVSGTSTTTNVDSVVTELVEPIHFVAGQTYTLSLDGKVSAGVNMVVLFADLNKATKFNSGTSANGVWTFTPADDFDIYYAKIRVSQANQTVNVDADIQLEKGSTATPYAPYGSIGVRQIGKNLFDKSSLYSTNGYLNASGAFVGQASWRVSDYIAVRPGSYITLSGVSSDSTTKNCWYDTNKNFISSFPVASQTVQVPTDAAYLRCSVVLNRLDVFQVEVGTSATGYTAYLNAVTPIDLQGNVLASLPDGTRDELIVDNAGHVTINAKTHKITLNGGSNEEWTNSASGKRKEVAITGFAPNARGVLNNGVIPSILCNRFVAASGNATNVSTVGVSQNINGTILHFNLLGTDTMTVDEWRVWLAEKPVTVYYPLAISETIDLGYIDPPQIPSGTELSISANLTPTLDAAWWTEKAAPIPEALQASTAAIDAKIAELEEAIADITA